MIAVLTPLCPVPSYNNRPRPSHRVKNRHVALKFLTADTSFEMGNTTLERSILKKLNKESNNSPGVNRITKLLHDFTFSGPNGKHSCLVFKPTGPSLSEYRKLFPGLRVPVPIVKNIARQLLQGLAYLHDTCNVVHTGKRLHTLEGIRLLTLADIKLQNILIDTPEMDKIFDRTPTELFLRESHPVNPPDNFYMQSTSFVPEEILKNSADISIKLADFGSGKCPSRRVYSLLRVLTDPRFISLLHFPAPYGMDPARCVPSPRGHPG